MNEERKRILTMLAEGKISAQEADELIDAIGKGDQTTGGAFHEKPKNPKYMYVKVQSHENDNVDVRVPLGLIRAGMRFTSLIPAKAMDHINKAMHENGMSFDLNNVKPDDIEDLVKNITEMEVNVKSKNGDVVRVYCDQ